MKKSLLVGLTVAMLLFAGSGAWAVPSTKINDLQENTPGVVFNNFIRLNTASISALYSDPYTMVENGGYQTLFPDLSGKLLTQAESDVRAVPLPPSLLLLASALLGLVGWRWQRFRRIK